ncbi:hypothetical protein [Pseudoroseicyclus aestuarii]|uniref:Uncharacterized protein n=1 Tax=Pseudoroseicyclus aestuarii TaxID=1795041 RepID=A0A318SS67_9RHOB|nr:hypothetical protein [Pseudoroseicyclus aestuarii]PYE84215.1 hypothetical protein DFP88_1027 [Pseudoroseicyclus aestuarii]
MARETSKSGGSGKAVWYAAIPIAFIVLVLVLVLGGVFRADEADEVPEPEVPVVSGEEGDAAPDEVVVRPDADDTTVADPQN